MWRELTRLGGRGIGRTEMGLLKVPLSPGNIEAFVERS